MAAHHLITLPPDPYADDPFSDFYVIFRTLPDYPGYGVDTLGNIWSVLEQRFPRLPRSSWRRLSPTPCNGYPTAKLSYAPGRFHRWRVHILVLTTFVGPRPAPRMEGIHRDGNPANNRLDNLRWGTHRENMLDRSRHGRWKGARGSLNGLAKLTEADIPEIRRLLASGVKASVVARRYSMGKNSIHDIGNGRTWGHVRSLAEDAEADLEGRAAGPADDERQEPDTEAWEAGRQ